MSQLLTLVRHAKSSWKNQGQPDFERPLNDRGRRDGPVMASRLLSRRCIPDLLLISTATRARQTADYLIDAFALTDDQCRFMDELYLADPPLLRDIVADVPESTRHVMVVAHNPGLEAFSEQLALQTLPPMPTLGVRHFHCPSLKSLSTQRDTSSCPQPTGQDTHNRISQAERKDGLQEAALIFIDYPKNTDH